MKLTSRGFAVDYFHDDNGYECSIQKSSSAIEDKIWLGLESASPQVLHGDATKLGIDHDKKCGWVKYPIPEAVSLNTRMHLTRRKAKELGEMLLRFSETGEL